MTFTTLDTGIYHIFLLAHQPAEVRAVDAELIETRHNPTQHFMDFISFGNNGQLAVERAEEAVRRNFLTGQHVAADVAEVFVGSHVTFENVRQQSADFQLAISGFQHFGTRYSHRTGHVHTTGIHQTSDEEYGFGTDGPDRFTLHYRRDVVNLYTYVACRMWSIESCYGNVLCLHKSSRLLFYTNTQIRLCHL